jgi:tripartite-type tricarboxylate transporter receptor subunit TctC
VQHAAIKGDQAMHKSIRLLCTAAALAGTAASLHAHAQAYPTKPIRAVLALGGGGETLARLVGQKMSEAMGQPVLIDPQPAVAGTIGASAVARAAPDGYTILYAATNSQVYRIYLAKSVPYDPVKDFTPIAMLSEAVLVVAVSLPSGISNMKDLVEKARQAPGKLFYGTSGVGTTHHLSAELLQGVTGIKMTHVPYKDPNQVATELIANRIPTGWGIFGTMYSHHTAGKLRIIAINNTKRYARTADIPTVGEQIPGYEPPPGWNGWFGPAGLPRPIVQRLNTEITRAVTAPDLKEKIDALGFIPTPSTPEELGVELKRALERTAKIVKAAGIEPE